MLFLYLIKKAPALLNALQKCVQEVGRPRVLKSDRATEIMGDHTPFNKFFLKFHIQPKYWEVVMKATESSQRFVSSSEMEV